MRPPRCKSSLYDGHSGMIPNEDYVVLDWTCTFLTPAPIGIVKQLYDLANITFIVRENS